MFAFWKYDTFPYVLGAETTGFDSEGRAIVPSYGNNAKFKPICVVDTHCGLIKNQQINALKEEYKVKKKELEKEYLLKIKEIVPNYHVL